MWKPIIAVSVGGTLGCLLRWWLGITFNALFPTIPPGTLAANLVGGYIVVQVRTLEEAIDTIRPWVTIHREGQGFADSAIEVRRL